MCNSDLCGEKDKLKVPVMISMKEFGRVLPYNDRK